jgi:hypothetical protein
VYGIARSLNFYALGLYFLPAPFTMQELDKIWGDKKRRRKKNNRWLASAKRKGHLPK